MIYYPVKSLRHQERNARRQKEFYAAKDAANCVEVLKKVQDDLGKVTAVERVVGGLGPTRYQFRAGSKDNWFHYYKHALGTGKIAPLCFK